MDNSRLLMRRPGLSNTCAAERHGHLLVSHDEVQRDDLPVEHDVAQPGDVVLA
ncbi:hypothetical protein [Amycolatopsis sp. DSM 110486]|uniref:hypothetical protein n=1 Tax=Amycolatopsis sp. DSM 110486 TaxID=2865832 RepID=UPI001C69486C|nr:hypothetical protein [Amycolatopsis sp. DSM 110486]QYN20618.1 hypothetical protein K1T34_50485 [Amycolatopsis sp. DSM 110486]